MKGIAIDRAMRTLELWQGDKGAMEVVRVFPVAIGMPRYQTPRGWYVIEEKVRQPDWMMPDSPWVPEELRGTIVEGGSENNPLKARWLGLDHDLGIGIHGTADRDSIGKAESHGCVRMTIEDVKELYEAIPDPKDHMEPRTPVFID